MSEKIVFIRTPVSIMRPLSAADIPILQVWANDPEVRKFVSLKYPAMETTEKNWIESLVSDHSALRNIVLMIETLDGVRIGTMGLHRINLVHRTAVTGALMGEKSYWGKGIGSITKMHFLYYAFEQLNLNKIHSVVYANNERSIRYSLRCGYQIEGTRKQAYFKDGQYVDEVMLGVTRDEWRIVWDRYMKTGGLK